MTTTGPSPHSTIRHCSGVSDEGSMAGVTNRLQVFLTGAHSGYLSTADPEFVQIPSVPVPDHAHISEKCV